MHCWGDAFQVSISSTLNIRIFLYECHFGSFYYVHGTRKKLPKTFVWKIRMFNIDEIDGSFLQLERRMSCLRWIYFTIPVQVIITFINVYRAQCVKIWTNVHLKTTAEFCIHIIKICLLTIWEKKCLKILCVYVRFRKKINFLVKAQLKEPNLRLL